MVDSGVWASLTSVLSHMSAGVPGALFLLGIATAVEFVAPIERHSLNSRLAPILYWMVSLCVATGCVMLLSGLAHAFGVQPLISLRASGYGLVGDGLALCVSILFADFLAYWHHRFQHRFIWRIHALHHSPTRLNAVSGYAHFGESIFQYLIIALPLSFVQFTFPATPYLVVVAVELMQRYIHMPIDVGLGPLDRIFVSNRFHRIHHSLEVRHFDRNFGILLSVWDRLFGTAYEPRREWPAVGIANNPPPANLWQFLTYPLLFREETAEEPALQAEASALARSSVP